MWPLARGFSIGGMACIASFGAKVENMNAAETEAFCDTKIFPCMELPRKFSPSGTVNWLEGRV